MKKAIFYEEERGWLHKCMFAGLDINGNPQWLVMERGERVYTQEEYAKNHLLGESEFVLLCEEGEKLTSTDIAKMMGPCLNYHLSKLDWRFDIQIRTLKEMGVEWNHTPLRFMFCVTNLSDRSYILDVECSDGMFSYVIASKSKIKSMADTMTRIRTFLIGLSEFADIKATTELVISKESYKKLSSIDVMLFNEITKH